MSSDNKNEINQTKHLFHVERTAAAWDDVRRHSGYAFVILRVVIFTLNWLLKNNISC